MDAGLALVSSPSAAKWSPSGKCVTLLAGGQLQTLRFADGQISADTPVETGFIGDIASFAVDDAGHVVAASTGGVYFLDSSGPALLHDAADIIEVRFGPGNILYAAAPDRLLRIDTDTGAAGVLLTESGISGLAVSAKTDRIYVAHAADRLIHVYDASGVKKGTIALDRAPTAVDALVQDSLLLLNPPDADGAPAMALQLSEEPSVVFIPADLSPSL
jgi:hypothetical protein